MLYTRNESSVRTNLRFKKGVYALVGGVPELVRRSYQFDLTESVMGDLQRKINPIDGAGINNIINIASSALRYDESNIKHVALPNPHDERRIVVLLSFVDEMSINDTTIEYNVNGYCDVVDTFIDRYGNRMLSPHCNIYINQIMKVVYGYNYDGRGNKTPYQRMENCDVIITGDYDYNDPYQRTDYSIRPMDVFQQKANDVMTQSIQRRGGDMGSNEVMHNNVNMFISNNRYKTAKRIDTDGTTYARNILKSFEKADSLRAGDDSGISNEREFYNVAKRNVQDSDLSSGSLYSTFRQVTNISKDGYVNFGDLCDIWPEMLDGNIFIDASEEGATEFRCDPSIFQTRHSEVVLGSRLVQSISSTAMECFITYIEFDVISVPRGQSIGSAHRDYWDIKILKMRGAFPSSLAKAQARLFRDKMLNQVLPSLIPRPDDIGIDLVMTMDILSKTEVSLGINGSRPVDMTYPSFCDGLVAPVVSLGFDSISNLSSNAEYLYDNLISYETAGSVNFAPPY